MDEQRAWIKSRRKRRLRLLAVTLAFCLLFTTYPDILEILSVYAAGTQSGDGTVYVAGFAGLPEEVREQTVPVGTGTEALMLPDMLEATVAIPEGEVLPEDTEEETPAPPESAEEETQTPSESAEEETQTPPEGTEEETEASSEAAGEETEVPPETAEEGTKTSEAEGTETEESADNTQPEGTAAEAVDTEEAAMQDNSDNVGDSGESAPSVQIITMPEYQAENVISVETLENTQETGTKEETVTIEDITWQSETAYDGNTEGIYIFTAVLPEGYALMEGVSLPQITVTVQADSADSVIQALLERIAALPDAEEYLAGEPETEAGEEAYEEWMAGLYQYAGEALDVQEACEALTSKQQAQIPEEAFTKLAAWVELAETAGESAQVMAETDTATSGNCGATGNEGNVTWSYDAVTKTLTISGSGAMASCLNGTAPWNGFKGDITTVVINEGVTKIGSGAFQDCTNLKNVTIPNGVTTIDSWAFANCTGLTSIELPGSATNLQGYVFQGCTNLNSISLPNVNTISCGLFQDCIRLTGITIPNTVKNIQASAFQGCTKLKDITIPEGITGIYGSAFEGCTSLTSINIPSKVTTIYDSAFKGCTKLATVTIEGAATIGESAFQECTSLNNVTMENVTSIGNAAFYGCKGLTSIEIPKKVTSIGTSTFSGCIGLTSVRIPEGVTSIGTSAFFYCVELTEVTIPDSVTSIGSFSFQNCTGLTSITIPDSVTSIDGYAFRDCTALKRVIFKATEAEKIPTIGENAFQNCPLFLNVGTDHATGIMVPDGCADIYKNAWNDSFPDFANSIASYHIHTPCGAISTTACSHSGEKCTARYEFNKKITSDTTTLTAGDNYYLAEDVTLSAPITISGTPGGTVNICLNGYTLTGTGNKVFLIQNSINVNICDCNNSGNAIIENNNQSCIQFFPGVSGVLSIYGGTIKGTNNAKGVNLDSNGTLYMYGGTINTAGAGIFVDSDKTNVNINIYDGATVKSTGNRAIHTMSPSTIKINGGTISNNCASATIFADQTNVDLTISGGNITNEGLSYAIMIDGTNSSFTMTDGTITGADYGVSTAAKTTVISGGTITSNGDNRYALRNLGGTVTINGKAVIKSTGSGGKAIKNEGTLNISGSARVTSTTNGQAILNGDNASGANNSGVKLTIQGGTITSSGPYTLYNNAGATATISGGTIENTKVGNNTTTGCGTAIENLGTLKISGSAAVTSTGTGGIVIHNGNKDSKPNAILEIKGGTFTSAKEGASYNLYNCEGSEITVSGGNFTSSNDNLCDCKQMLYNCNGAVATISNITINGTGNSAPLANFGKLTLTDVNVTSSSFALQNSEGANLEINGGTFSSSVHSTFLNHKNATATISGTTIENTYDDNSSQAIDNKGAITIKGEAKISSVNGRAIVNGASWSGVDNSGVSVKIEGGTITSSGTCTLQNNKDATVTISGGTIENTKAGNSENHGTAIENTGGTVTITGGTVESKNTAIKNSAFNGKGTTILKKEGEGKGATISSYGVYTLYNDSGATVTISGGTIHNERGSCSGYSDAIAIFNKGNLDISSGTVQSDLNLALRNEATSGTGATLSGGTLYGGANGCCIYNGGNLKIQEGCSINAGSFPVSNTNNGDLTILGGTFTSNSGRITNEGKLNLSGNPTFTNTGIWLVDTSVINITGALNYSEACPIYVNDDPVTADSPVTFTSGWNTYMPNTEISQYFTSGLKYCTVDTKDNEGILRPFKVTFDYCDDSTGTETKDVNSNAKVDPFPNDPTKTGYVFGGWFNAATGGTQFTSGSTFDGDTTLYACWEQCTAHTLANFSTPTETQHTGVCTKCGLTVTENHEFTYSVGSPTFYEKCKKNCGHRATATLTVPENADLTYTGSAIEPATITYGGNQWVGAKPTVEYINNINVGTATAKIQRGSIGGSTTFEIKPKSIEGFTVTIDPISYPHTGSAVEPDVTVKDGEMVLVKGTDYTVEYSNNTSPTEDATVTVTGQGNYTGTISKTFTIKQIETLPENKPLESCVNIPKPSGSGEDNLYGDSITITPKDGWTVGTDPNNLGSGVNITEETGPEGNTIPIYLKDPDGNFYTTEFTYKLDKTPPVVSGKLTVEGANISFTPTESGKAYWIVSDTVPTAEQVKEQSAQKGGVLDITSGTAVNLAVTATEKAQTVYVVLEDAAGNLSNVEKTEISAQAHTHTFSTEWSKDENNHWHAATCGHTTEVSGKAAHSWDTGEVTSAATCTQKGVKTYTCSVCSGTKTEEIPAIGHEYKVTWKWAEAADDFTATATITCTHTDSDGHCNFSETKTTGKTAGDVKVTSEETKAAACEAAGERSYTASLAYDGKTYTCETVKKETIPAKGHTLKKTEAKKPTSTEAGNEEYWTCTDCGKLYADEQGKTATDRDKVTIQITGDGFWIVITPDGVKIVGYSGSDTAVEVPSKIGDKSVTAIGEGAFADCTGLTTIVIPDGLDTTSAGITDTAAKITYKVEKDGKITITSVTPGKDSDGGKKPVTLPDTIGGKKPEIPDAVKEAMKNILHEHKGGTATCTQKAVCEICGKGYGDFVEHTLVKTEGVEPTCTADGKKTYWTCSECKKKFSDENGTTEVTDLTIPATGHTMQKTEAKKPTSTEAGNKEYWTCSGCGKLYEDEQGNTETDSSKVTIPATGDGEAWNTVITSDGVKIVGYSGSDTAVEVPSEIDGQPVTAIGKDAFSGCTGLTTIMIPDGLDTKDAGIIDTAAKITYKVDENGKITITSVTPGKDSGSGKKPVTLPDTIGGKKPEIPDAVKEAMKNILHEHKGGVATCTKKAVCEICGEGYGDFAGHDYEGSWQYDASGHWKSCSRCKAEDAKHSHHYDNDRDSMCNDCGYKRVVKNPDDEQPTLPSPVQPAPQPEDPVQPAPQPEDPVQPTPQPENPVQPTPQPTDTPDNKPENEQKSEDKQKPDDTPGQGSTESAQTKEAQTVQVVIDGGKLTMTGDLVTTGNITETSETTTILQAEDGAVIVTVVCEEESYTAGVKDTVAVTNAVLYSEQVELVNDGETIEIRVDVKDISETAPGQDQEVIESGLAECRKEMPDLTLGMYVDISIFIKVGEGDWNAVTSTTEPIEVVIGIPEELKGDGREFYIIRSHDGEYTLLPDTDDNPDTITVSTDMFSAYALVYKQADKAEVSAPGESSTKCWLCHIYSAFLGIPCFIWLAVIVAVFQLIGVVIWRRKEKVK